MRVPIIVYLSVFLEPSVGLSSGLTTEKDNADGKRVHDQKQAKRVYYNNAILFLFPTVGSMQYIKDGFRATPTPHKIHKSQC